MTTLGQQLEEAYRIRGTQSQTSQQPFATPRGVPVQRTVIADVGVVKFRLSKNAKIINSEHVGEKYASCFCHVMRVYVHGEGVAEHIGRKVVGRLRIEERVFANGARDTYAHIDLVQGEEKPIGEFKVHTNTNLDLSAAVYKLPLRIGVAAVSPFKAKEA